MRADEECHLLEDSMMSLKVQKYTARGGSFKNHKQTLTDDVDFQQASTTTAASESQEFAFDDREEADLPPCLTIVLEKGESKLFEQDSTVVVPPQERS